MHTTSGKEQSALVFGLFVLGLAKAATALVREKRCACEAPIAAPCSCGVGPTPFCSCKSIIPSPSCPCALQSQVTHCNAYCQKICQPACYKSWIPLPCPSLCGSLCSSSCMSGKVVMPMKAVTTSVILPYQCPTVCQRSCHKMCSVQMAPTACMNMCQRPCVRKCILAAPFPHEVEIMAEPALPLAPPPYPLFDGIPLPLARPGCMGSGCMMENFLPHD